MERLPYAQRMRNRCIAITVLVSIIVAIVHCSSNDDPESANATTEHSVATAVDSIAEAAAFADTNAFDSVDTYTSLKKQVLMMRAILLCYDKSVEALKDGANTEMLINMSVRERVGRFKYEDEANIDREFEAISTMLEKEIKDVLERSED